jgi:hypothetical protein
MKTTTKRHGSFLSPGCAALTAVLLLTGSFYGCSQPTNTESVTDYDIPGKNVVIRGLPSLVNPVKDKIEGAVNYISTYTGLNSAIIDAKNYIALQKVVIVVEDVPPYASGYDFRMTATPPKIDEFAMRYAFLSSVSLNGVYAFISIAIGDMNDEHGIVSLGNEFNDAKKTVRLSQGKFRMPQRLA